MTHPRELRVFSVSRQNLAALRNAVHAVMYMVCCIRRANTQCAINQKMHLRRGVWHTPLQLAQTLNRRLFPKHPESYMGHGKIFTSVGAYGIRPELRHLSMSRRWLSMRFVRCRAGRMPYAPTIGADLKPAVLSQTPRKPHGAWKKLRPMWKKLCLI